MSKKMVDRQCYNIVMQGTDLQVYDQNGLPIYALEYVSVRQDWTMNDPELGSGFGIAHVEFKCLCNLYDSVEKMQTAIKENS